MMRRANYLPSKLAIFVLLLIFSASHILAADDAPTSGVTAGILGGQFQYVEAGYSFGAKILWPKSSLIKGYGGFTLGVEAGRPDDRFIIAPKISFTVNMFISFGASVMYYTDFNLGALRFRPEIGIGSLGIRIAYGRNITMANYEFTDLNGDNLIFTVYLPVFDTKQTK